MILEKSPFLFLPHSLHPIPAQPAKLGRLQHTMAELKAHNRKFVGSLIRFHLLVSEKEIQSSALKAGGEELANTAVFYTELLKVVAAWWQAGDSLHTRRALVCSRHAAQHSPCPRNPVHFRINRYMFLSQSLMVYEIGPSSLYQ